MMYSSFFLKNMLESTHNLKHVSFNLWESGSLPMILF